MPNEESRVDEPAEVDRPGADETVLAGTPVTVRRNAGFAAVIGAAASAIAIAYLWRAVDTGAPLDWVLCVVLAGIAGFYLAGLMDARTPLVVADDLGVRIRLGDQWRGLPWDAVAVVEVHPRRGLLRDGRLVFRPHSLGRALDGLEVRGRRSAAVNQKMYGAVLAVPLGLTTRTSAGSRTTGDAEVLGEGLAALSRGRADVLVVVPEPEPADAAPEPAGAEQPLEAPEVELETPDVEDLVDQPADRPATTGARAAGLLRALRTRVAETVATNPVTATAPVASPTDLAEPDAGSYAGPGAEPAVTGAGVMGPGSTEERGPRRGLLGGLGTIVSRVAKASRHDEVDAEEAEDGDLVEADETDGPVLPSEGDQQPETHAPAAATVAPLRAARPALRAEVTRDVPATTLGAAALHDDLTGERRTELPEGRELRRPGSVDLVFEPVETRVRPIARLGDPVEPLVIDDFVTEPAYDPVIGPELAAARTRVGLTVDELAERTRIRPHVIESIEVDDFAPCGGDFYARGHLRTLARVLGQDPQPLLATFDARYATAPINARKVFEAELATGMTGTMRSTVGGPNWGLLVGAVLSLVLVWGLVRLFATEPPQLIEAPAVSLNGSGGVDAPPAAQPAKPEGTPLPIMLVANGGASRVVVRDGDGKVVFAGQLVMGERKTLRVDPPVHVRAGDAGAVEVRVKGKDRGTVGELGQPGRRTFHRPR